MQLQSGTRLGPYEIVERVGSGGMGEVYRARDTRLSRSVAIKVLPSEFAADSRVRLRFEREAKTISALNHPHICTLHDVGRENGLDYLVMEFCEGQTLARRLERGALPVEQGLQYGIEIADALSRAHHAGIIHRDLKPSNIMLTKSGVKLLDFGLAKAHVDSSPGEPTAQLVSEAGKILGTIPYMAPELLAGGEADARSDIFALGLVLYEMLTGKPAFSGTSKASVMASILEREPPPLRELQPNTPAMLEHIIQKCLRKDPDERWESAHDIAEELRWIREGPAESKPPTSRARLAVGAVVVLALIGLAANWALSRRPASERVVRMIIPLSAAPGSGATGPAIAVSPDATRVAYCVEREGVPYLYVRHLDSFETSELPGTAGAQHPFFSADGQWIGYFVRAGIRKVPAAGGSPQIVGTPILGAPRGAWWAPDDTIYFSRSYSSGLWKVSASGGRPQKLTEPNPAAGENSHRWPQLLPDGKHILFTIRTSQIDSFDNAKIAVLSLDSGRWKAVVDGGTYARYVSTGHLLFTRAGALYSVPFDLPSLSIRGTPRKVLEGVITIPGSGVADYGVSDRGDLFYLAGGVFRASTEVVSVDRSGHVKLLATLNLRVTRPRVSPDGRKIAFNVFAANDDVWIYDLDSGVATRATFEPGDEGTAVWTPDGTHLIYSATGRLMIKRADGAGEPEELLRGQEPVVTSCSPDGQFVTYTDVHPETGYDVWLLPLNGDRKPRPLVRTRFNEYLAQFSPDGKWIVYAADEPTSQIYVRSASGAGGRSQVSTDGGGNPMWSTDGKEVFYRKGDGLFAVHLTIAGAEIRPGKPQLLFSFPTPRGAGPVAEFDVTKNGFVMLRGPANEQWRPQHINVVLNWTSELR